MKPSLSASKLTRILKEITAAAGPAVQAVTAAAALGDEAAGAGANSSSKKKGSGTKKGIKDAVPVLVKAEVAAIQAAVFKQHGVSAEAVRHAFAYYSQPAAEEGEGAKLDAADAEGEDDVLEVGEAEDSGTRSDAVAAAAGELRALLGRPTLTTGAVLHHWRRAYEAVVSSMGDIMGQVMMEVQMSRGAMQPGGPRFQARVGALSRAVMGAYLSARAGLESMDDLAAAALALGGADAAFKARMQAVDEEGQTAVGQAAEAALQQIMMQMQMQGGGGMGGFGM